MGPVVAYSFALANAGDSPSQIQLAAVAGLFAIPFLIVDRLANYWKPS